VKLCCPVNVYMINSHYHARTV